MRVLFVLKEVGLTEPLGVMYLSSSLRQAGHQTKSVQFERVMNPFSIIRDYKPEVIAYSVTTGFHSYFIELNREIKEKYPGFISLFGGPHPTFFPEIINDDGVDAICVGEGERAVVDLANSLDGGKLPIDVPNIWIKDGRRVHRNPPRPLERDIDKLPEPDRDVVYNEDRYLASDPIKHFLNLRGCPYDCTYCFNHAYRELYSENGGYPVRYHSVNRVIKEVSEVKRRYGVEFVRFLSDVFATKKSWLREFAERFPRDVGLPFSCNVRADLIDEETAFLLKKAGCVSVLMGIESADDRMRVLVLGRKMSRDVILRASELLKGYGIAIYSQNMIGLPGETFKMAIGTLKLNAQIKAEFAWASIFTPYPRTRLGDYAVRLGYFDGDYDNLNYSYHSRSALTFRDKDDKEKIENLHKLFSIASRFGFIRNMIDFLCELPLRPIYWLVYRLWYGFALKRYIFPVSFGARRFIESICRLFRKDEG